MIHSGSIAAPAAGFSLYAAELFPLGPLGIGVSKFLQNLPAAAKVKGLAAMILLLVMHGLEVRRPGNDTEAYTISSRELVGHRHWSHCSASGVGDGI